MKAQIMKNKSIEEKICDVLSIVNTSLVAPINGEIITIGNSHHPLKATNISDLQESSRTN